MAKYRITAPDGQQYVINAPDDATEDQVLAYAQENYQQAAPAQEAPTQVKWAGGVEPSTDPTEGMSDLNRFLAGAGKSVSDTGLGIRQLYAQAADAISPREPTMSGLITGQRSRADEVAAEVDEAAARDAPLMETGAGKVGNFAGQVAQTAIPAAGLAGKLGAAGRLAQYGSAAAQGAAFSALQPVETGGSRALNTAIGGVAGAAGQGVANVASRLAKGAADKLSPSVRKVLARAEQAGIPVTAAQLTGSKALKTAASALNYLPLSGGRQAAAAQQEAFNRALSRGFGANEPALTDDVIAQARNRIGSEFQRIYGQNDVMLDTQAVSKLIQIQKIASRNLPPNEAQIVQNQIGDIISSAPNGSMPGLAYQAFRTDRLLPAEQGARSFLTKTIRDVRKVMDEAADRSVGPQDAQALRVARNQYRNLKTVEKALTRVDGAVEGNVAPSRLWSVVNQKQGATKEMRELAKVGQLIKDPIPDSGTAARLGVYSALASPAGVTGLLAGGPVAAVGGAAAPLLAGATVGRALNSPRVASYLAGNTRANRVLEGVAKTVRPAPVVLPALARGQGNSLILDITGGTPVSEEEFAEEMRRLGR